MSKTSWLMLAIGIAAAFGLFIFYGLGYKIYTATTTPPPVVDEAPNNPAPLPLAPGEQITLKGKWECLPHRGGGDVQTLECAFGLAVDDSDAHYALDLSALSNYPVDYSNGEHLRVVGTRQPHTLANNGAFLTYDIDDIIAVHSITKI